MLPLLLLQTHISFNNYQNNFQGELLLVTMFTSPPEITLIWSK